MANVLPTNALKDTRKFYRARFLLVGSLAALGCAGASILALLPAYAVIRGGAAPTTITASKSEQEKTDQADMARSQQLLRALAPVATSTPQGLAGIVASLQDRTSGITIDSARYEAGSPPAGGTIVIGGAAASREAINSYAAALRADTHFKNVSVPLGALAGPEAGRFTMTLTGTF